MPEASKKRPDFAWAGSLLAVAAAAAAITLRFGIERLTGMRVLAPLCGFSAVAACVWWAGFGPALVASALTTAWLVWEGGAARPEAWLQYLLYASEAGVFCYIGRRLHTLKDQTTQGQNWQRHLVETTGEGIWTVDPDGVIVYASQRMAEILGCDVAQIEGRRVDSFFFPANIPAERIRFQNRRPGVREQYDRRLRRADGSEVWTLACSSPFKYRGQDAGLLTMMTDITERKKAEQALRRSEQKFRELFENIREGVYQTSPDGRILAANPELLRMLGFSNHEELNVAGVVRDTLVDADLHHNLRDRLERDGSYTNVEFQLRTRDRRIITVRENARVVRDENGAVLYYEGTFTDITKEVRFKNQLRRVQEMEALGRLAGGIGRDFQSIGRDMSRDLQEALDSVPADSPTRRGLDALARSIQSVEALTQQILGFSERPVNDPRDCYEDGDTIDLNALVVDLGPALGRLVNPEICLELSLCRDPAPVVAHPAHMQQIVTDFVIQARGFGEGVHNIELTTLIDPHGPAGEALHGGPFVKLSVKALARRTGDPGLRSWVGMATAQAILAQYGGMLTSVAEPASGELESSVCYSLHLPLASMANVVQMTLPEHSVVAKTPTVLLVEEEPLIRELSRDMLERHGLRVLTARDVGEAERMARGQQRFDVLILDWKDREDGSGAALLRQLRAGRPDLQVLFVAEESTSLVSAGEGTAVLQKPFSGAELGREVRKLAEKSQAAGQ